MGGTLDNGIYLPDQGERNCYNGLKNNWDTLDNLIETVQALSSAGLTREIVNSLPTENIKTNVIYMLRNSQQSGDLYDEYMYINNAWEPIGTSATEMDNYYTKSETNALPAVASGITASKVTGYDSHVANTEVHITAAERSTWNGKQNALDTDQTAAVNSGVNATKVTEYDTHVADTVVHVTASDKTAWNAKQDGLSQAQLNAVNSGITSAKVTGYDTHVGDTSAHVSSSDRTAWNGKQDALSQTQLDNIAAVPDKANSADLATVATTGDYGDLLNAPTIPTVNNATLTIQKNGTDVATFTANASSNVTANLAIPTDTSDLTNGAGFLTQHNPIDNELSVSSENAVQNKVVTTALNGKAASSHTHAAGDINTGTFNIARIPNLDASKITSGTIDIARLPKGSLERLVKVADQAARYALTTDDVQLGDTVQQLDTGVMYAVTDETKLDSADGYTEFTAGSATSVPWSGVTGKPSTFTPSSHTHGNITNDGKVGTTANLPLITGTGGAIQAGAFGNQANTFCEGNDSRLSDARTPVAHTHLTADVTDLLNTAHEWTGDNTYTTPVNYKSTHTLGNLPASVDAQQAFRILDSTGTNFLCDTASFQNTTASGLRFTIRDKFDSDGFSPSGTNRSSYLHFLQNANSQSYLQWDGYTKNNVIPLTTNTYDLGSSSYQWNNLYAKNYFYNGVAWGLDKANVWTGTNTFRQNITYERTNFFHQAANPGYVLVDTGLEIGTVPTTPRTAYPGLWQDKNNQSLGYVRFVQYDAGVQTFECDIRNKVSNGSFNPEGSLQMAGFQIVNNPSSPIGTCNVYANVNPNSDNTYALGSTTRRWKTLNGINPGALSLPDAASDGYIDLSDNISVNTEYSYTPTVDGWLALYVQTTGFHAENAVGIFTGGGSSGSYRWACSVTSAINLPRASRYNGAVMLPVKAGIPYLCWITIDSSTTLSSKRLYFYKATGNV